MNTSSFERLLEDVLREELLTMGLDYDDFVDSVFRKREGEAFTIRFRGDLHDLEIVEPEEHPSRAALAAMLRRKLETTLRRRSSAG